MSRGRPKGTHPKQVGRPKGALNKATRDIKELIQSTVDWPTLIRALEQKGQKNPLAARILFEYGFGKPREIGQESGLSGSELIAALKGIASAFMENPGQGVASSADSQGAE